MPCFHPLKGWRSREVSPNGKRPLVFNRAHGFADLEVTVPCGGCIGCRLDQAKMWSIRCMHEAALYPASSFITLTYNDDNIPEDWSLDHTHFQKFMKRLRKKTGGGIRFFMCGEYGEDLGRPHFHALLFNCWFADRKLFKIKNGFPIYTSGELEKLWPFGFCTVGDVTVGTAGYVARYVTKKITGDMAEAHYKGRKPEYCRASNRPGIGSAWLASFGKDVYPDDFVVIEGRKYKVPRFYDKKYADSDPDGFSRIRGSRVARARLPEIAAENTPERLAVRKKVLIARTSNLKRELQ